MEKQRRINDVTEEQPKDNITNDWKQTMSFTDLGLTPRVSKLLQRYGITNLERLLNLDYNDLRHVKGLGIKGKNEILMCIHSFGYEMSSESSALEYQNLVRKNKGEVLLEDLGLPGIACKALNRAGIYTLETLIKNLNKLDEIPNVGTGKKMIVEAWLEDLKRKKSEEGDLITPQQGSNQEVLNLQTINNELQQEIDDIKQRTVKKQNLLKEYQRLIAERKQLLQQEQELDRQLDQIRGEQNATPKQITKTTK